MKLIKQHEYDMFAVTGFSRLTGSTEEMFVSQSKK